MLGKIYLCLFILCAILHQVIFGTFVADDIGRSSNVLDRVKRVISRIPEEDVPINVGDHYLVNIKKNRRMHCIGSILSHHTVITAASCVVFDIGSYKVLSGARSASFGVSHNITHKAMHGHNPSGSSTLLTGIALITVTPPFSFRNSVSQINLNAEPVLAGMSGTVLGWGSYVYGGPSESSCAHKLRSITVPIMNQQECRNIYRGYFQITDEYFCTYHAQRQCGYTDTGAPFVINYKLVGVHIGGIDTAGRELAIKPDVFLLLQNAEYRQWINRNIVV